MDQDNRAQQDHGPGAYPMWYVPQGGPPPIPMPFMGASNFGPHFGHASVYGQGTPGPNFGAASSFQGTPGPMVPVPGLMFQHMMPAQHNYYPVFPHVIPAPQDNWPRHTSPQSSWPRCPAPQGNWPRRASIVDVTELAEPPAPAPLVQTQEPMPSARITQALLAPAPSEEPAAAEAPAQASSTAEVSAPPGPVIPRDEQVAGPSGVSSKAGSSKRKKKRRQAISSSSDSSTSSSEYSDSDSESTDESEDTDSSEKGEEGSKKSELKNFKKMLKEKSKASTKKRRGPGRPPGSKNKATLLKEAMEAKKAKKAKKDKKRRKQ